MDGDSLALGRAAREALLLALGASLLGIAVDLLRPDGLPLVARTPYRVLVPCPEPVGEAQAIEPGEAGRPGDLLVDARPAGDYAAWHAEGAVDLPFDYLEPVAPEQVAELVDAAARSGARRVVVYGDGQRPDSGEQLARELAGRGVRNVFFVRGGAPALRARAGGER